MKVLVIDDDPFVLKLFSRQLSMLGFRKIDLFQRASEALSQLVGDAHVDTLVFCDLQMPEMDGIEFVRHLAHHGYRGSLVLVSGEDNRILQSAQRLADTYQLNILGCLQKPVKPHTLRSILNAKLPPMLGGSRDDLKIYSHKELKRALTQNELVNFYQPKIEVTTGRMTGVETLVRWQHPTDGLVFPNQFISVAEQHGLINDLTECVLSNALHQIRQWKDAGLSFHVAVNISMDNVTSLDFPDRLEAVAKAFEAPLSSLILEVTESRLMQDRQASLDIFTRLRLKNTGLSIDDFGTGHSSLVQLRDMPFDELKIDRGFVHGAYREGSEKAIFEASLGMAKKLGIRSVAEGVEDANDWAFLRTTECDLAQGFYIGKPMLASELENWIGTWKERSKSLLGLAH
ncbi:EAL domain-containing response regulator [Motiliproteus sp.]|uniref:EAL domain-containing response regulator n=1 Tax=Motiliproteus sp. TaxID=1898955 RepID=UPI003BACA855